MILRIIKKIGMVIAILVMATPVYILYNMKNIDSWIFLLIISIAYDVYMYSVISYTNEMDEFKEKFPKIIDLYKTLKKPDGKEFTDKEKYDSFIELVNNSIIKKDIFK